MITFICSHCSMIAESSEDSLEYGTMLICNHCGRDTVVQLVKGEDYSKIEMGLFIIKSDLCEICNDVQARSGEVFLGQVDLEDEATIKIYVRSLPARFYRAEITTCTGKIFNIQTGSGTLNRYWPVFLNVAQNLIEITAISEVVK